MKHLKIGFTCGDLNGIGLEVVLKTLLHEQVLKACNVILYCSPKVASYHKNIITSENLQFHGIQDPGQAQIGKLNVINCWQQDNVNITIGKMNPENTKFAIASLERGAADLKAGKLDGLITAPLHKAALAQAGFPFPGHTEYFASLCPQEQHLMCMVHDTMRIAMMTGHVPIEKVSSVITKENCSKKLNVLHSTLIRDFGIEKPTIAVLGLNPHAGEEGTIGKEEKEILVPVIQACKEKGQLVFGPFPADGFFGSGQHRKFDGILAMYHDQGLVPFKLSAFHAGTNMTAGLSLLRTSPDHGTAYEIAGKNEADPGSMLSTFWLTLDIARNRQQWKEDRANPLQSRKDRLEHAEDEALTDEEAA